jgi:hypothetical protein
LNRPKSISDNQPELGKFVLSCKVPVPPLAGLVSVFRFAEGKAHMKPEMSLFADPFVTRREVIQELRSSERRA